MFTWLQVVGPVALVSLLLNDGLVKLLPGSDVNDNPNQPADPAMQEAYNHAAIQASALSVSPGLSVISLCGDLVPPGV